MKKFYFSSLTILFLSLLFIACKKDASEIAVQPCTVNYGFADSSNAHPKNAKYTELITNLKNAGVPSVSMMIEDSSGLWYKSIGLADIENNVPLSMCHKMKIASITKLFNATLIYKLADQGKLHINDKISKYISADIIAKLPNAEKSTIADLMQHSSGIYDFVFDAGYVLYTFNNLAKEKNYTELLQFAYNKKPAFEYASKRSYNYTTGYILLAMIIEKVSGQSFSKEMRSQIFAPLGLTNTAMRPFETIDWTTTAKGYFDYRKHGILQDLTALFTGDGTGFTGIYSTPNDLRIFTNALYKHKTVLSSGALSSMMSAPSIDDSISYGVGCRIYGVPQNGKMYHWYGHPGGEVNYASGTYYCPEKNATVTYMLNYGDAFDGDYSAAYLYFRREILRQVSN
jgi:D-alanyl-D-alanine carboxypeptidase